MCGEVVVCGMGPEVTSGEVCTVYGGYNGIHVAHFNILDLL